MWKFSHWNDRQTLLSVVESPSAVIFVTLIGLPCLAAQLLLFAALLGGGSSMTTTVSGQISTRNGWSLRPRIPNAMSQLNCSSNPHGTFLKCRPLCQWAANGCRTDLLTDFVQHRHEIRIDFYLPANLAPGIKVSFRLVDASDKGFRPLAGKRSTSAEQLRTSVMIRAAGSFPCRCTFLRPASAKEKRVTSVRAMGRAATVVLMQKTGLPMLEIFL